MRSLLRRLSYVLKSGIGRFPGLYFPLYKLRPLNRQLAVGAGTDLVIEGYPRSANTYAVVAFRFAQPRPVRLAHHLHVPAQILRAADLRVPALVLIREPREAVLSFLIRDPLLSVRRAFLWYASFYETVETRRDAFVLATFREVTSGFSEVIGRVNQRFGTGFRRFDETPAAVAKVNAEIDELNRRYATGEERQLARPTPVRDELKRALVPRLSSARIRPLLERSEAVHHRLVSP